jgi:hypothetical protein
MQTEPLAPLYVEATGEPEEADDAQREKEGLPS